jgi:hypothetical protein
MTDVDPFKKKINVVLKILNGENKQGTRIKVVEFYSRDTNTYFGRIPLFKPSITDLLNHQTE